MVMTVGITQVKKKIKYVCDSLIGKFYSKLVDIDIDLIKHLEKLTPF
jgi:hypothetical protein